MEIIPAIYILNGECVALYKGDYSQKAVYYKSPLEMGLFFERGGAKKIYLVDLNGKKDHTFQQQQLMAKIIRALHISVIIEAGFQTISELQAAFRLGAHQVVMRSPSPAFIHEAINKFGSEKIIIQLQSKGSQLIDGDIREFTYVVDYAEKLVPLGVKYIIYKDEQSEGTLVHPNYDEVDHLFLITGQYLKIYVSGGISELKHLKLLKKIGASGAIIGKAFFERMLTIHEAEEAVASSV